MASKAILKLEASAIGGRPLSPPARIDRGGGSSKARGGGELSHPVRPSGIDSKLPLTFRILPA
jgi:hypothetical protein